MLILKAIVMPPRKERHQIADRIYILLFIKVFISHRENNKNRTFAVLHFS